ncbi:hypothetical protein PHAVU_011G087400 [Phaseolus vulgaris]|uniref:RING-type E3 ubiquitin transferase n=1 Tax=Phaseolus vulgaris TaxID=3885 RepID=V7AGD8_PHAVU|nr:hypothetical protein PHAVU_011G087400g [Phaseolus vulgaris]ESW04345.1 hypothetical protein PHAVU_011G087400g [Phaseolus vulgaris]
MPHLPHASHATNASSPQVSLRSPLEVSIRPMFISSVAYIFLILFVAFFFIGFVFLYFQKHSSSWKSESRAIHKCVSSNFVASKSLMVVAETALQGELLLLNKNVPMSTSMPPLPHTNHATNASSSQVSLGSLLEVFIRLMFISTVTYVFLILFAAFFFIGFVFLYFQKHSSSWDSESRTIRERVSSNSMASKSLAVVAETASVAYVFVILFTAFFFIGFVFLYFQKHFSSLDFEPGAIRDGGSGDNNQGECTICLEEVGKGEVMKMIVYCRHVFHADCINRLLEKQVTCPV